MTFYSYTFVLVAVSVMLAIVTTVLIRTPGVRGPPAWIYNQLLGIPGTLLGLNRLITSVNIKWTYERQLMTNTDLSLFHVQHRSETKEVLIRIVKPVERNTTPKLILTQTWIILFLHNLLNLPPLMLKEWIVLKSSGSFWHMHLIDLVLSYIASYLP